MAKMELQGPTSRAEDQIRHFSHPEHTLYLMPLPYLYTCNLCKEYGAVRGYRCESCKFDIHEVCAKAPQCITHPYHIQHQLYLRAKPGSAFIKSKCGVCGKVPRGFAFHCVPCHVDIHPSCARLPQDFKFYGHPKHGLKLLAGPPFAAGVGSYTCNFCGKRGSSWVYHCAHCDFYLHASCAKAAINGLQAQGICVPPKSTSFGRATRFATRVLKGFIDGLVESIAEGVADVVMDNISREVVAATPDNSDRRN